MEMPEFPCSALPVPGEFCAVIPGTELTCKCHFVLETVPWK